jgi:hypothetical protein
MLALHSSTPGLKALRLSSGGLLVDVVLAVAPDETMILRFRPLLKSSHLLSNSLAPKKGANPLFAFTTIDNGKIRHLSSTFTL